MNVESFKRQVTELLDDRECGKESLPRFVSRLESMLDNLEGVSEAWRNRFFEQWMILEEVNAVRLDRNERPADYNEDGLLQSTTLHCRSLLSEL